MRSFILRFFAQFYWTLSATTLKAKVTSDAGGWVALGFSDNGGIMSGSEAVLGTPSDSKVEKVNLNGYSASAVVAMSAASQTLTGTSIAVSGGVTTMEFEKLLAESGEVQILSTGATTMIAAYGSSGGLSYHLDRGSFSIDLSSCGVSTIKTAEYKEA